MRPRQLLALLCACLLLVGCVRLRPDPWQPAPETSKKQTAQLLARDWLGKAGKQTLRLQGRLVFGSRKFPLSAFMRRDTAKRVARVVLMGDMGVTLCDMDVTPSGYITHQAVPDLEKATRVQRHIARTVRRIFLLPLPNKDTRLWQREGEHMLRYTARKQELERVYDAESLQLVRLVSPDEEWETRFLEYEKLSADGLPYPARIEYRDASGGYSLQLLLLSLKPAS